MKTLVLYYSYDGDTAKVADILKEALGADELRLERVKEKRRSGFAKYFFGGMGAIFKPRPALKPYTVDFDAYDMLVLGCPVWAGSPAPAMMTFLDAFEHLPVGRKKVAVFCCCMGGQGKTLEIMKEQLSKHDAAGEACFVTKEKSGALEEQVKSWAADLLKA